MLSLLLRRFAQKHRQWPIRLLAILLTFSITACNEQAPETVTAQLTTHQIIEENSTVITIEDAQRELETILNDIDAAKSRVGNTVHPRKVAEAYSLTTTLQRSRSENADSFSLHVFNFADNNGFAMMSGDTRIPSLIALTESGELAQDDVVDNPGFAIFLEGVEGLINRHPTYPAEPKIPIKPGPPPLPPYTDIKLIETKVYFEGGMCPVKWYQGSPFNDYCPTLKNGKKASAGCVPVSIAQLMAVHKYPLSYNYHRFDWKELTRNSKITHIRSKDQAARLIQQLSLEHNLNVTYSDEGGFSKRDYSIRTLRNFGYSQPGRLAKYNADDVIAELRRGYPVLLAGNRAKKDKKILWFKVGEKYGAGHQWLAHGLLERRWEKRVYSEGVCIESTPGSTWYILCNWGWGGLYDGYYLVDAFKPRADGDFS